jgi:4-amino-4-deoxy-L-arabinose transferase-like glycosyltransferase
LFLNNPLNRESAMKRDRVALVFLILGLGFALLGQVYFTQRREFWRDGFVFWGLALLLFLLLQRRLTRRELGHREPKPRARGGLHWFSQCITWASQNPWRVLSMVAGMGLSLASGVIARSLPPESSFAAAFWLWVAGVTLFWGAFLPVVSVRRALTDLGRRLYRRRVEMVGLLVLLLVALLVRVVNLEHIPANLGGDEAMWGLEALAILEDNLGNPFATSWFSLPTLPFLFLGLSMRVFGTTVAGLRMFSVLTGTASILTTFLLARELWGRRVAWFAAVLLAFGHYHMHFSRLAYNCVTDGFLITLTLYLAVRGARSRRPIYFVLLGVVMGLGMYEYYGARLGNAIAVLYLLRRAVEDRHFRWRYLRLLTVSLVTVFVVAAPLLVYYLDYPAQLSSSWHRVSILSSDWFAKNQAYFGVGPGILVWRQFWKSITAFHYTLDPTFHYRASIPLLDFVSGVLFLLGFLYAAIRRRWRSDGLLLFWFWVVVIMGWVLTENPPSSHRMVVVAPALALLVGLGLNWLVELGRRVMGEIKPFGWGKVATVVLMLISILNLRYYFVVYTPMGIYGNPTAEVATRLGRYLQEQELDYVVYFCGAPTMYADIGNLRFLARDTIIRDVREGEDPTVNFDDADGVRFVFLPHRQTEIETVRERFPGGQEKHIRSKFDNRLLYVLYEVPRR